MQAVRNRSITGRNAWESRRSTTSMTAGRSSFRNGAADAARFGLRTSARSIAVKSLRTNGRQVTSALTIAEASRAILRARAGARKTTDEERVAVGALRRFERRSYLVAVTDAVLARVGRPFPVEPIRTLDAIHPATTEVLGEPPQLVTVVTRDSRVRENALTLGCAVE